MGSEKKTIEVNASHVGLPKNFRSQDQSSGTFRGPKNRGPKTSEQVKSWSWASKNRPDAGPVLVIFQLLGIRLFGQLLMFSDDHDLVLISNANGEVETTTFGWDRAIGPFPKPMKYI